MISRELNAIYTIWLREMKRFVRARSRIIGNIAMPFFFLAFLGMGINSMLSPDSFGGMSYLEFLAPGIIQAFIILGISMLLGVRVTSIFGVLFSIVFILLISMAFVSLGIAFASKMQDMQGFQLIMNFLIMPIWILSGAFFPLEGAPAWLSIISRIDPLTYGVDGLRSSLVGIQGMPWALSIGVLLAFSLAMIFLASWLFRKTEV
jgi:ABC-2 type transport system permease protein